jgi:hypothetical protein
MTTFVRSPPSQSPSEPNRAKPGSATNLRGDSHGYQPEAVKDDFVPKQA